MRIAENTGADILSVDSMQVYRGLDIGTAKPTVEERARVPHHMIDVVDPETAYTVAEFRRDARHAMERVEDRPLLIVGGSGLHFRSVVDPMTFRPLDARIRTELDRQPLSDLVAELLAADPNASAHVDLANRRRVQRALEAWRTERITPTAWAERPEAVAYRGYQPEIDFVGFGIDHPAIADAIDDRLERMWEEGLLDEVFTLASRLGSTARQGVGYRQLVEVVEGRLSPDEGKEEVRRATHALVKRQRTFFGRDPRLKWLDPRERATLESIMDAAA